MNLFFRSKLYLHFQVWQCKSEVKRTQMCRKYKQKWWLSINLQRNRTRFISLKRVYSPNSRLVVHTVYLKYRRAKFRMSRNWILILKKNKEIREMICLSGNLCSHSFFFACNVREVEVTKNFELLWEKWSYPLYSFLLWKALFLSQEITGADHKAFNNHMIGWNKLPNTPWAGVSTLRHTCVVGFQINLFTLADR